MTAPASFQSLFERVARHVRGVEGHLRFSAAVARLQGSEATPPERSFVLTLARTILCPLAAVGLTTVLMALVIGHTAFKFESIVYVVPVIVCAIRWGLGAAIVSVLASAAAADFLFMAPVYSFAISDPNEIFELGLFLFVALVTSHLTARVKNEVEVSHRREREIQNLYEFSRRLALCSTAGDLVEAIQHYLSIHLGCEAYLIRLAPPVVSNDKDTENAAVPDFIAREAKAMLAARPPPGSRVVTDPDKNAPWALKSITTTVAEHGVLAVNLGKYAGSETDKLNEHIDTLLSEASATLTRIDAAAALARANVRLESEVLKTALIGTASHELRSPIAAILGTASVLDQMSALYDDEQMRSLVVGMRHEAKRLDNDIQNLLDTARIADSGLTRHLVWTDPADIVTAAIRQRSHRTAAHKLNLDVDPVLPLINVDPALLEQAMGQLIENAVKYSPAGSEIAIVARAEDCQVVLSVTDRGAGLTEDEAQNLFRRSYRGRRHVGNVPGLGLGLWIARIFVAVNGGVLTAHSCGPGQGTIMSIRLPVVPTIAPELAPSSDAQTG